MIYCQEEKSMYRISAMGSILTFGPDTDRTVSRLVKLFFMALVFLVTTTQAQPDYDKKLNSIYRKTVKIIRPNEVVKSMVNNTSVILLDTRTLAEFDVSHLPGARFLNYDFYTTADLIAIPKDSKVIVYCSVGYRSERVGEKLMELGYKNVSNIYGGIFEWKNEGFEVVNKLNQRTDSVHTYNRNWSKWLVRGIKVY
jgi:rhodanese-related sulfurtransferase